MSDIVIFRLKKLWPYDIENKPSLDAKCAKCGHAFQLHTFRDRDATCGIVGCRCRQFMVNLYEEIKNLRKTSEWRDASEYWCRILTGEPMSTFDFLSGDIVDLTNFLEPEWAWFTIGYPKANVPRFEADITALFLHRNSDQFEIKFEHVQEKTENRKSLNLSSFF